MFAFNTASFNYFFGYTLKKAVLDAALEQLTHDQQELFMSGERHTIMGDILGQAGTYDDARDAMGMEVGEGHIPGPWTIEVQISIYLRHQIITTWLKANHDQSPIIEWEFPIQVCHSGGGYYIGINDDEGLAVCRLSCEYYPTYMDALKAFNEGSFKARLWV